jgi:hypothetical protein
MEGELVYCCDIPNLIQNLLASSYDPEEWRLFIDSSKRSLKAMLLNNGNELASVPVAHSTSRKENYVNLEMVLEKNKYYEHNWIVCCDLKVYGILLGQQGGYTKFPCSICEWDSRSREKQWVVQSWPQRMDLEVGTKNIISPSLINPQKILLPPLHIKLGIMKQLVKALDKNGPCFQYLTQKFPLLTTAK